MGNILPDFDLCLRFERLQVDERFVRSIRSSIDVAIKRSRIFFQSGRQKQQLTTGMVLITTTTEKKSKRKTERRILFFAVEIFLDFDFKEKRKKKRIRKSNIDSSTYNYSFAMANPAQYDFEFEMKRVVHSMVEFCIQFEYYLVTMFDSYIHHVNPRHVVNLFRHELSLV